MQSSAKAILIILFFIPGITPADVLDIAQSQDLFYLNGRLKIVSDCNGMDADEVAQLPDSAFKAVSSGFYIPASESKCFYWLRFSLCNLSDSSKKILFYAVPDPAYQIYIFSEDEWLLLSNAPKDYSISLVVLPGDTGHYHVRLSKKDGFGRRYITSGFKDIYSMVDADPGFFLSQKRDPYFYFTLIFIGMAGMMAIYLLINYLQLRDSAYLYYSLNILCIVALVSLRIRYNEAPSFELANLQLVAGPLLQIASHLFYFLFASSFLNLRTSLPALHRFFRIVGVALATYIIVHIVFYFSRLPYELSGTMFFYARILLILIAFGSIAYAWILRPSVLLRLFAIGTFLMVVSAMLSFILSHNYISGKYGIWSVPFFYFLMGYLIDIVFFTLCLAYKNRMEHKNKLKLERELLMRQAREQEERLMLVLDTQQKERDRMALDLHDELGSGLSTIRFLSESMKMKTGDNYHSLNVISSKSAELIDNMRQIIWSINPEFNNLNELLLYMKKYCGEYLDANKMDWNFSLPYHIPAVDLSVDMRRNLFSVFKEALHNIIKHANAKLVNVKFDFYSENSQLICSLKISDDGKGIHFPLTSSGNGLKNMERRMKEIGGDFILNSANGTTVYLNFSLSK